MDLGLPVTLNLAEHQMQQNMLLLVDVGEQHTVQLTLQPFAAITPLSDFDVADSVDPLVHLAAFEKRYTLVHAIDDQTVTGPTAVWIKASRPRWPASVSDTELTFTDVSAQDMMAILSELPDRPRTVAALAVQADDPFTRVSVCQKAFLTDAVAKWAAQPADARVLAHDHETFRDPVDPACRNIKAIHDFVTNDTLHNVVARLLANLSSVRHYRLVITQGPAPTAIPEPTLTPGVYVFVKDIASMIPALPAAASSTAPEPAVSRKCPFSSWPAIVALVLCLVAGAILIALLIRKRQS
jgi:hypothetical protein